MACNYNNFNISINIFGNYNKLSYKYDLQLCFPIFVLLSVLINLLSTNNIKVSKIEI